MIDADQEFRELLAGVRAGSEDAAWELVRLYAPHVHRVVSRMLKRRIRTMFDSVDFIQAVWASFFREPARIQSFDSASEIIGYLVNAARYKVNDELRRRLGTEKFDVGRERSLTDALAESESFAVGGPTAHDIVVAREEWDRVIANQPAQYQEIVRRRFCGASFTEIANDLHIHERTARKVIDRVLSRQSA